MRTYRRTMFVRAAAVLGALIVAGSAGAASAVESQLRVREFRVPSGTHPHDVAPARDGGVWYTAQHTASSAGSIRRPGGRA
jgi:virginiamycin B lyase